MIKVLATTSYIFGQANTAGSTGLIGQLTKLQVDNTIIYVRENINGIPSFLISSGERWGDKIGRKPSRYRQVLELCAPGDQWAQLAEQVTNADTYRRSVIHNKSFTPEWAETKLNHQ